MAALNLKSQAPAERHASRETAAPPRRVMIAETAAAGGLVLAVVAMATLLPVGAWSSPMVVAGLIAAYAGMALIRLDLGMAFLSPAQLVFVVMWFAVPPAFLPLAVAAGLLLEEAVSAGLSGRARHPLRVISAVPNAWHAVGPALVLSLAGAPEPTLDAWPVFAAAIIAQLAFDITASALREFAESRMAPVQVESAGWFLAIDVALTPVGVLAAVMLQQSPLALVSLAPVAALFLVFARERDQRIQQAVELSSAYRGTALLLGDVLEADDAYTGGEHSRGVVELALEVGRELQLDRRGMRDLEFGALLHDIGKLRVSNDIINKPGKLTEDEWQVIRRHPVYGQEMLDRVGGGLAPVAEIVRAHHERIDGGGYPDGLRGDEIPIAARIICACDAYSAMTTTRSYRAAMRRADAVAELRRCAGAQFDVRVVDALLRVVEAEPDVAAVTHLRLAV